ncbi:Vacuolar calcium ion transporter [Psilocybe cubensis]|uniref:Vacuolar calcium ion transporter n=2 Tax=Psilocybe cubensis TaxID=181762 RepID=A0ACB8H4V7_PSICU|nr:Vacuolar calcium ion transporter [Psilocybe cubensis]KAH9482948.1 Vacuolar calcium ion transporter [Psilocybe cubensis]
MSKIASTDSSESRQRTHTHLRIQDLEEGSIEPKHSPGNLLSAGAESRRSRLSSSRLQELGQELGEAFKFQENKEELVKFWDQFTRKGKRNIGVLESLNAIFWSSWLNIFLFFIPVAWVSHFLHWNDTLTFSLCFFAIVPLERLFDYGGEQMAFYLGKELGDLVVVTLNNAVEATLAIILLKKCELILLKSTIIGVVILHLLLVPGTAFVIGGARIIQQDLHPHSTQLNHSLLTLGVLSLLIPASFFSAISGALDVNNKAAVVTAVDDNTRHSFLQMSRGLAVLLLFVYLCSRIYLHNPPGDSNDLTRVTVSEAPEEFKEHVAHLRNDDPEVNQWVCMLMLAICIAFMATTAEYLVESIDFVQKSHRIKVEWFGLILLPFVSFAADGTVAVVYFVRYMFRHIFHEPTPPTTLAKGEAIDLSIQFTLFWMPLLVLIGWWTDKPLSLLFETFEVAVLLGSCFLVNYVTADSKTNWAEGIAMVAFYLMIAVCSWFYPGQVEIKLLSTCNSVQAAIEEFAATGLVE